MKILIEISEKELTMIMDFINDKNDDKKIGRIIEKI